jgi:hypothetical protein
MREIAMRRFLVLVALCRLLLGICGAAPAASREYPVVAGTAAPDLNSGAASRFSTVSPLPPRAPLYQIAPPSVREPQIGAAPNRGPITDYGPGGLARMPGSPPNPPYR